MTELANPIERLVNDNNHLLRQLTEFITTSGSAIYALNNEALESGSIGGHVRHIIDHYLSTFTRADIIDYDARARDQAVEQNSAFAADAIYTLIDVLHTEVTKGTSSQGQAMAATTDKLVQVRVSTNVGEPACVVGSTLARELCFLHSHTTHHMAIIRLLALHNGVQLPSNFGKASSTLKFESR